jgi:TPR repeat protein
MESEPDAVIERARALAQSGYVSAAAALLRPIAQQGVPDAQFQLAELYFSDDGVVSRPEAESLFRLAANSGHADATFRLSGFSTGADSDALLLRAADLGSTRAARNLGACYATGDAS